jgi:probable rRNA maturation factor
VILPTPGSRLADDLAAVLEAAGAPSPASVGLIAADDAELARLNEQAMGRADVTDVLSFPLLPPEAFPDHPGRGPSSEPPEEAPGFVLPPGETQHLGEVVVSVERAVTQAKSGSGGQTGEVRWAPADELRLLAVHGTLHLCGWDHARPDEEAAMRALERRLLGIDP